MKNTIYDIVLEQVNCSDSPLSESALLEKMGEKDFLAILSDAIETRIEIESNKLILQIAYAINANSRGSSR